jgi:hypothetical protein
MCVYGLSPTLKWSSLSINYLHISVQFIVGFYQLVSEPSYPNLHPYKQSYISDMTMWEEIEAIFDKIDERHREFQLQFSQPFYYSLIQKLPKINRSSRNHCTCRLRATSYRSTHSATPMDFAPHHNHLLLPVPHLPLWLSNCKKKMMCFLHLA